MDMTLEQYILNPMGKKNAVLNSITRETIRKDYSHRFDNILLREHSKIEYHLYKDSKTNTYWSHIKVPSEVVKDFYYDVVFKFYTNENVSSGGTNLFKYNVKFFSNDPAFVYTYAHVFLNNDLMIKELLPRMTKKIKKEPVERNPTKDIGYVKAIYFAYLTLLNKGLNKIIKFEGESSNLDIKYLLNNIEDADTKIKARQEEGEKVSRKKKIKLDNNTAKRVIRTLGPNQDQKLVDRIQISTTKSVGKIKNKSSVKSTKTISSVKKK